MDIKERDVPEDVIYDRPLNIIKQVMLENYKQQQLLDSQIKEEDKKMTNTMSQIALQSFAINGLYEVAQNITKEEIITRIDMLRKNMNKILNDNDCKLFDLLDEAIPKEIEDIVEITQRVDGERSYDYVKEVFQPLILYRDKPIKPYPMVVIANLDEAVLQVEKGDNVN